MMQELFHHSNSILVVCLIVLVHILGSCVSVFCLVSLEFPLAEPPRDHHPSWVTKASQGHHPSSPRFGCLWHHRHHPSRLRPAGRAVGPLLLMDEILHHLGCIKPGKYKDKLPFPQLVNAGFLNHQPYNRYKWSYGTQLKPERFGEILVSYWVRRGDMKGTATRWAPTRYRWSHGDKWPYKWVTGFFSPL